jgi:DNA polymerase IV
MQQYYDNMKDTWRALSYRKAVGVLKRQQSKIRIASEAKKLPGIGPSLAAKIEEIGESNLWGTRMIHLIELVQTDQLKNLESTKLDPVYQSIKLFVGIYGIGFETAKAWAAAGHRTLEDILMKEKLSESQKIGLEHFDDFNTRMTREEVAKHAKVVTDVASTIDEGLHLEIMGSFRRVASSFRSLFTLMLTSSRGPKRVVMCVQFCNQAT